MLVLWDLLSLHLRRIHTQEKGLSTAELLGNAALAIGVLVGVWMAMEGLGAEVVNYIKSSIFRG